MATSPAVPPNGRIIFDENFGRPHLDKLRRDIANDAALNAEILHALMFQEQGVWDEDWIPQCAADSWIIISHDRGQGGRAKGEPFPSVCIQHKVTHILLSAAVEKRKMVEKFAIITALWPDILALHSEPRGSRFLLMFDGDGGRACLKRIIVKEQKRPKRPPQS